MSLPRQLHVRGTSGRGRRRRRRSTMRNCAFGMDAASCVGATVMARAECGPACDSSSARDARGRSERCVSQARLQPRAGRTAEASRRKGAEGIACLIRSGRRGQGHMALQGKSSRSAATGARAWITGSASHQEAMGSLAGSNCGAQTKPPKPQGQLRRAQAGVRQGRGLQLQTWKGTLSFQFRK